jgi:5-methyltetrahydropteroyltriglutamate--homocysteine methyltransferase
MIEPKGNAHMTLPTEPIGSIPRPDYLLEGQADLAAGRTDRAAFDELVDRAVRDTIERFDAAGSPVVTDGEQAKPSFATYPLDGVDGLAPDGVVIPFADGHTRTLPLLTRGPFR